MSTSDYGKGSIAYRSWSLLRSAASRSDHTDLAAFKQKECHAVERLEFPGLLHLTIEQCIHDVVLDIPIGNRAQLG